MQINIFWHFIFILNAINLRLTNIKVGEKDNLLIILKCSNKIDDFYMSTLFHFINILPPTHPQT